MADKKQPTPRAWARRVEAKIYRSRAHRGKARQSVRRICKLWVGSRRNPWQEYLCGHQGLRRTLLRLADGGHLPFDAHPPRLEALVGRDLLQG